MEGINDNSSGNPLGKNYKVRLYEENRLDYNILHASSWDRILKFLLANIVVFCIFAVIVSVLIEPLFKSMIGDGISSYDVVGIVTLSFIAYMTGMAATLSLYEEWRGCYTPVE